jgi:MinD superfamily P-loop ATPase
MIISVASGKGGTGKTTVAVSLALTLLGRRPVQFLDCDVEEPNAHLFIKPSIDRTIPVFIPVPEVDEATCTFCGKCAEVCAYNAIAVIKNTVLVFSEICHGCGGCSLLCPEKAIKEVGKKIGVLEFGAAGNLQFVHGKLDIGQPMSPPLIRAVKKYINTERTVIIDVPPGTSCPVIEAIKGSDFCLLVTEPTPFGLHDLRLAVETVRQLKIPLGVIINRTGLGDQKVEEYCQKERIPILMTIPFDRKIAAAYSEGIPVVEAIPAYRQEFFEIFERIEKTAG